MGDDNANGVPKPGLSEIEIEEMGYSKERGLDLRMRHPGFATLVNELADLFLEEGAVNVLEMQAYHDEAGPLTVTIQRQLGKTPMQLLADVKAEAALLREQCSTLLTALIDITEAQSPPIVRDDEWHEAVDKALCAIEDARSNDA